MDDENLIQAARDGKEHAGPFLVSLYAPMLVGYAHSIAADLGDSACEQICEWAVERAVRKIDLFDPSKGNFVAWARSMVRYAALDYRRDNARLDRIDDPNLPEQAMPPTHDAHDKVRDALRQALRQLTEPDQAILALRDLEQLPPQAVASLLGISAAAVRQRHLRARRRLAALARKDPRLNSLLEGGHG